MTEQSPIDLNASLSSLAMLSLEMQGGKDYLDYLHGFVIDAIRSLQGEPFDALTVQRLVQQQFGLKIPCATYAIYLKRLVKAGTISPILSGVQFRVARLPPTTTAQDRKAARARITEATDELARFAQSTFSLPWDSQSSARALADFLRKYSIDFLRFAEARSPLPEQTSDAKTTDFVVASFITVCARSHPGVFESIKVLVQSHILANALMCPDLAKNPRAFRGVYFLADTRFLLKALDLESQYDTDNVCQLLAAIRTLGGVVCLFQETRDELRSVLNAIIRGMQHGSGRGPVYRELLKRGRGVADVIITERNLDRRIADLKISTLPSPRYEESNYQFQIDEGQLRDEIENEVDYISARAAEHDIRVVRHIFALRKGKKRSAIENCGYVFLTTNSALSRAAFHYEKSNSDGWFFSTVVTDYHLSHLAWLKSPMEVPDLPRAEILASCYAAMRPHESFWARYLTELERWRAEGKFSERDHEVLRFSINAADELMAVTRGDVEGLTEKNLHVILGKLERTYAAEKESALQREREEHERTRAALGQAELSSMIVAREKQEALQRQVDLERGREAHEAEIQRLKRIESDARAKDESARARIDRLAGRIANACFYACGAVFAICAALAFFEHLSYWFGVPAALLGFFHLWAGFSGSAVKRAVRQWIGRRLTWFVGAEKASGIVTESGNTGPAE